MKEATRRLGSVLSIKTPEYQSLKTRVYMIFCGPEVKLMYLCLALVHPMFAMHMRHEEASFPVSIDCLASYGSSRAQFCGGGFLLLLLASYFRHHVALLAHIAREFPFD